MKNYLFLLVAILLETLATTSLKASEGFTKPLPTVLTILGYIGAFYFLSLTLKTIPLGIAYAIWAGVGIVLTGIVGFVVFKQTLDTPTMIGIALIVAGVVVINLFSQSTGH